MLSIIGVSLSEPHIDHDNVPCRGECLYLCIYLAVCSVCRLRKVAFEMQCAMSSRDEIIQSDSCIYIASSSYHVILAKLDVAKTLYTKSCVVHTVQLGCVNQFA